MIGKGRYGCMRRFLFFGVLLLVFWGQAWIIYQEAESQAWYMSGYYREPVLRADSFEEFLANQKETAGEGLPQAAGWSCREKVSVQGETEKTEKKTARLWSIKGDMSLVFAGSLLEGSFPWQEDENGCLISRGLSLELFGSSRVQGNQVRIQGKVYRVRGVVNGKESFLALPAKGEEKLSGFRLKYGEKDSSGGNAREFFYQMTGNYPEGFFEGNLYSGLARLLFFLPFCPLLAKSFLKIFSAVKREREGWRRGFCIAFLLCAFLGGWVLLLVCSFRFSWDYFPSRWSELSFYPQLIRDKRELMKGLEEFVLCLADDSCREALRHAGFWSAGATLWAGLLPLDFIFSRKAKSLVPKAGIMHRLKEKGYSRK